MRLDPAHAEKLRSSILVDEAGETTVRLDIEFMLAAMCRLTPWERGILTDAILRSTQAKRPTIEQRALLALFLSPLEQEANNG